MFYFWSDSLVLVIWCTSLKIVWLTFVWCYQLAYLIWKFCLKRTIAKKSTRMVTNVLIKFGWNRKKTSSFNFPPNRTVMWQFMHHEGSQTVEEDVKIFRRKVHIRWAWISLVTPFRIQQSICYASLADIGNVVILVRPDDSGFSHTALQP